jgi:hypothetical protein
MNYLKWKMKVIELIANSSQISVNLKLEAW